MNLHRRLLFVLLVVVAAAALAACGSSGSSSSATSKSKSGGSGAAATAKQKCLDETKKIQNGTARSTAEQACRQITNGNEHVDAALKKARSTCLNAAQSIPIDSLKKAAVSECKKISGS